MSLDIYLEIPAGIERWCECLRCGKLHTTTSPEEGYEANITHNLGRMAQEAGIYHYLWRPEEMNITQAGQLILALRSGLAALTAEPEKFKQFNPANGWGTYEGIVEFVESYLDACEKYPEATIRVSR